jgi:hypothetical protein
MITACARNYSSVHMEVRMAGISKNMVKTSMHIDTRVVESEKVF